jgi:hypothetical protein
VRWRDLFPLYERCRWVRDQANEPGVRQVAFTGERILVEDVMTEPLWELYRALAQQNSIRARWSFPIRSVADKVLGTIAIYYVGQLSARKANRWLSGCKPKSTRWWRTRTTRLRPPPRTLRQKPTSRSARPRQVGVRSSSDNSPQWRRNGARDDPVFTDCLSWMRLGEVVGLTLTKLDHLAVIAYSKSRSAPSAPRC